MAGAVFQPSHGFVRGDSIRISGVTWAKASAAETPDAVVFDVISVDSFVPGTTGVLVFTTPKGTTGELVPGVGRWLSPTRLWVALGLGAGSSTPAPSEPGPSDEDFAALEARVQALESAPPPVIPPTPDITNRIWFGA